MGVPVTMEAIREVAARIAREFDPERIILFGSRAHGTAREDSDVDLLVLMDTGGQDVRATIAVRMKAGASFPLDVIVRNPDDAKRRYAEWDPVLREAIDRGVTLYERAA